MKQDTRQKIINTASDLFYEKGYNLTGINEIIEKSDIAKATLYSHFKSKEDLLLAYLDEKDREATEKLMAFTNKKAKGNKRIISVLEFLNTFYHTKEFNGCWCVRSVAEVPVENEKVRKKISQNKQKFLNVLQTIIKENRPDLHYSKQKQLAQQVYVLYEGAMTESHLHSADWPIKTAISLLKDKLKYL